MRNFGIIIAMLAALGLASRPAGAQSLHDIADRYREQDRFNGVILVAGGLRLRAVELRRRLTDARCLCGVTPAQGCSSPRSPSLSR
jgi:hypothetical protein